MKKYVVDDSFFRWFFADISRWLNRDDNPSSKGDFETLINKEIDRVIKKSLKRKMYARIWIYKEKNSDETMV